MISLNGKHVLVGISGGIAAYKTPGLVRLFMAAGACVKVAATEHALKFVTTTSLQTVSRHPVYHNLFAAERDFIPEHIDLAVWADVLVMAPATANIIGKLAHGIADDLLSTVAMSCQCPVVLAPAMNNRMYASPAVQENLGILTARGHRIIEPDEGGLACGTVGKGRLAALPRIVETVQQVLSKKTIGQDLAGIRVLVTAGRTEEPIDPVRVLTNRSSGRMGYAVAMAAQKRGAAVVLVTGRADIAPPADVTLVKVRTAAEMQRQVLGQFRKADVLVMVAAVSDYTVKNVKHEKIKKDTRPFLELTPTADILAAAGKSKKPGQVLVGFAVETSREVERAREKLKRKNLDLIVVNNPLEPGAGFEHETNVVTLVDRSGRAEKLPQMPKTEVAERIMDRIAALRASRQKKRSSRHR
jgi:phosphopantothenoylcysteine decarboxylase/phosphopantothenate--cysteine ligase